MACKEGGGSSFFTFLFVNSVINDQQTFFRQKDFFKGRGGGAKIISFQPLAPPISARKDKKGFRQKILGHRRGGI